MGSATRESLSRSIAELDRLASQVTSTTAQELFSVEHVIGTSASLRAAFANSTVDNEATTRLISRLFGGLSQPSLELVTTVVTLTWSAHDDIVAALEELAVRAVVISGSEADIISELFAFGTAADSNAELELALRGKLTTPADKVRLVERILRGKVSAESIMILSNLVSFTRGRSLRVAIRDTANIVAAQRGCVIATVISATELPNEQATRIRDELSEMYGAVTLNRVVDPHVLGGLRIEIGHNVIDGSVFSRLQDLRLQLVG